MASGKSKRIDKALRQARSEALRAEPDLHPGWTPDDLGEALGSPAVVEAAHGVPVSRTPVASPQSPGGSEQEAVARNSSLEPPGD